MAAVGLAIEAPGRHPGVEILGAVRHRLQQVQQVQPNHPHGVRVGVEVDVEPLPQVCPGADVAVAQAGVAVKLFQQALSSVARFGDSVVAAGEDGGQLLHGD